MNEAEKSPVKSFCAISTIINDVLIAQKYVSSYLIRVSKGCRSLTMRISLYIYSAWLDRLTTVVYIRFETQEKIEPTYVRFSLCHEAQRRIYLGRKGSQMNIDTVIFIQNTENRLLTL